VLTRGWRVGVVHLLRAYCITVDLQWKEGTLFQARVSALGGNKSVEVGRQGNDGNVGKLTLSGVCRWLFG
jgi:hypothetical protein